MIVGKLVGRLVGRSNESVEGSNLERASRLSRRSYLMPFFLPAKSLLPAFEMVHRSFRRTAPIFVPGAMLLRPDVR